ncbi:MAG: hypothetical protein VR66_06085 [Peptococcaceae bacterium BRH_c23]|nr:MAG: hypothetical protein VR66_06085 [Peptococcaceae bacterium BRH_c23]KJS89495.1 MAG: hypothetical protein JL57_07040 [Desulfosporosinus sp. BICA1-9]
MDYSKTCNKGKPLLKRTNVSRKQEIFHSTDREKFSVFANMIVNVIDVEVQFREKREITIY